MLDSFGTHPARPQATSSPTEFVAVRIRTRQKWSHRSDPKPLGPSPTEFTPTEFMAKRIRIRQKRIRRASQSSDGMRTPPVSTPVSRRTFLVATWMSDHVTMCGPRGSFFAARISCTRCCIAVMTRRGGKVDRLSVAPCCSSPCPPTLLRPECLHKLKLG